MKRLAGGWAPDKHGDRRPRERFGRIVEATARRNAADLAAHAEAVGQVCDEEVEIAEDGDRIVFLDHELIRGGIREDSHVRQDAEIGHRPTAIHMVDGGGFREIEPDARRVEALLSALGSLVGEQRRARFVCIAAMATPDGELVTARGECTGYILDAPRGRAGFGYDPVFQVDGSGLAMAELPVSEKNRISHRAQAFTALGDAIRATLGSKHFD